MLQPTSFFNKDTVTISQDYFYIAFPGNQTTDYSSPISSNCKIMIRISSVNSGTPFTLTGITVSIDKYTNDLIGGTFTANSGAVTGSFLFENVGDGNWYFAVPFY